MPTFEITAPDGTKYQVEGPDGATEQDALAQVQAAHQPAAPSVAGDVAKSIPGAVERMVSGTAGMGGDIRELLATGVNKASGAIGYEIPQNKAADVLKVAPFLRGPTSQQFQSSIENMVGGKAYEAQTPVGKVVSTGIELAPGLIGGGEGLATKLLTRVAAPAGAMEAAKTVTDNPYLQVGAGVGASVLAHRAVTPRPATQAPLPTNQEIRTAAQAGYEHPEVAAVQIQPASVERLADRITADLNRRGQLNVPESAGATHNILDRLRDTGNTPGLPQGVASIAELRSARMALGGMSTELNNAGRPTSNAVAAGNAGRQIDAYLDGLRQPDLVAGNAQRASAILRQANRDWAAASKSSLVDLQQMKADRQAGRSGSGTNIENSMRQKIDSVFGPGKETGAGLTAAERAAADRIVEGSPARNALRRLGKVGFGDGLSILLHMGAAPLSGGLSIPVGIAGTVARRIGEGMTRRDIGGLEQMMRGRSAEAERWRAIQARINAANPQGGLLGQAPAAALVGLLAARQRGLLPLDQAQR